MENTLASRPTFFHTFRRPINLFTSTTNRLNLLFYSLLVFALHLLFTLSYRFFNHFSLSLSFFFFLSRCIQMIMCNVCDWTIDTYDNVVYSTFVYTFVGIVLLRIFVNWKCTHVSYKSFYEVITCAMSDSVLLLI